ncbi:hypothetical protein T459_22831 [Capsicum annuum]|uniref:Plastid lipid-associated protein/fibrillin conserved domain-containing protein n=1 Tax=Capsicum annuum TaxID=4072 RepID=A0A2G2YQL7_CAPAN|nr:hypothetical protein T459_22831 [Capsicum annuum]
MLVVIVVKVVMDDIVVTVMMVAIDGDDGGYDVTLLDRQWWWRPKDVWRLVVVLVVIDEFVSSRDWPVVVDDCDAVNGGGSGEYKRIIEVVGGGGWWLTMVAVVEMVCGGDCWFTAFSELLSILALGTIPLLKVEKISQAISTRSLTIENSTTLSSPVATLSFSATVAFEVQSPSRIQVTQDAQPFENPIELLINEAFGGLRHETVDAGPLQVAGEEETLHDLFGSNYKDYFELLKDGSEDLYEGSKIMHVTSRWKPEKDSNLDHAPSTKHMRWHAEDDNKDGILRRPRDGEAWKRLDTNYPEFASDPRNVRLGLASDGFNPFGAMSTNYSIWPVVLFPYNLSPWLCTK